MQGPGPHRAVLLGLGLGGAGLQAPVAGWGLGAQGRQDGGLVRGRLGALLGLAGRAPVGDHPEALHLVADGRPGAPGALLADAGDEQRQPAEDHVAADAALQVVVDGPDVEVGLETAEAALDLQQLSIA